MTCYECEHSTRCPTHDNRPLNWSNVQQDYNYEPLPDVWIGNVVGVSFIDGYPQNLIRLLAVLKENGPISARIIRNPDNKYDSNACEVWVDQSMIGHLSKELAAELTPRIDSGSVFEIVIRSIGFVNGDTSKPGASFLIKKI